MYSRTDAVGCYCASGASAGAYCASGASAGACMCIRTHVKVVHIYRFIKHAPCSDKVGH